MDMQATVPLACRYADFAASLRSDGIPPEVRRAAQRHVVDMIGVALATADSAEPTGAALRSAARLWAAGSGVGVLGTGQLLRPESAALVNGSLAQALEMDDKHGFSLARPGSTVIPASLAVAEARGASLGDLLTSVVAGYEVMIRLGLVAGKRFLSRGYHTSSLLGGFGAVAAVGNLCGISADRIVDALGIVGTMASGIQESTRTGSTSKVLHGGWGAHAGIIAIDLASAGISGPDTVFEGQMGFFQSHLTPVEGGLDWVSAASGLGAQWRTIETAIKPFPCCQLLHSFIVGLRAIHDDMATDGVSVADIESITCRLAEPGLTLVSQPLDRKLRPREPHEARFSLPYVAAHTLLRGEVGLTTFRPEALADEEVLSLATKVRMSDDPDSDYPRHCPADIEIVAEGRTFRKRVPYHPGSPEAPLSQLEIVDKFERNTAWLLDGGASVAKWMMQLPEDTPVADLVGAVTGSPGEQGSARMARGGLR